jgi:autotransporter-associated beta strand protein
MVPSAVVSFSGASVESRLILLGHSLTLAGISDSSGFGVIENTQDQTGVSNVTVTVNNSTDYSFNGALRNTATGSGTLAFIKNGTGAQTLSGSNIAYTGGTTVSGGRLILQDTTNAAFLSAGITNNAALEFNATDADVLFSNRISGIGSLTKSGPRKVTLSGSSITYSGGTTITGGTLALKNTTNATLLSKNITDNGTLELNTDGVNLSLSGAISGTGGLNKTGSGTLTLSGTSGNTFTGDTYVNQGILILAKSSGLAIPGNLYLSGMNGMTETRIQGNNQIPATTVVNFTGGYWPHFELVGHYAGGNFGSLRYRRD